MFEIFKGAGLLICPVGVCLVCYVYIIWERLYSRGRNAVLPDDLVEAIVQGRPYSGGSHSVLARILDFAEEHQNDEGAMKAYARLEINRLERGIPYLDIIYAVAPLIGLTGTVTGLLQAFSHVSPETGR